MSEVHVIGQIIGAKAFPDHRIFCKWSVHAGDQWRLLQGTIKGVTMLDVPVDNSKAVWMHPIDIHFATSSLKGWPRFQFTVWHHDRRGRDHPYAYGCAYIPSSPGNHRISCATWRPLGTRSQQLNIFFKGGGIELNKQDIIHASSELYKLRTVSMGSIDIDVNIITRNFSKFGVSYN
ncbi:hypothetical protein GJ496_003782 [Pomphorhynchus laevis]|nr:hypothetical protein GJ496_003782 [Pomphorhynchus laevis]